MMVQLVVIYSRPCSILENEYPIVIYDLLKKRMD